MAYSPIPIFCSPTVTRKDSTKPMCSYFDISFLDPSLILQKPLHVLVFNNHYVSSVSCAQQVSDGTEFVILDRKVLMPSMSSCNGAQQIHTILASSFNSRYRPGIPIRIYLFQPWPHWNSFDLKNVKAYALEGGASGGVNQVASITVPLLKEFKLLGEAISARNKSSQNIIVNNTSALGGHSGTAGGKLRRAKDGK